MTTNEHTSQEQEFERLTDVYNALIYGTHEDVGSGGYTCVQGCVTDGTYGAWHGHVLAALLDQERPLAPGRIELTDPNDPRWRDGALVEVECHRPDSEFVNTFRRRVFNGMAHWENLAGYLSSPNWRVYLIEEAPEDPRLALIREYVSDPEDAVALLARLDEVQA